MFNFEMICQHVKELQLDKPKYTKDSARTFFKTFNDLIFLTNIKENGIGTVSREFKILQVLSINIHNHMFNFI